MVRQFACCLHRGVAVRVEAALVLKACLWMGRNVRGGWNAGTLPPTRTEWYPMRLLGSCIEFSETPARGAYVQIWIRIATQPLVRLLQRRKLGRRLESHLALPI